MTIPRALDIMGAWGSRPPVHLMIKAYMGIGKDDKSPVSKSEKSLSGLADVIPIQRGKSRSLEEMVAASIGV